MVDGGCKVVLVSLYSSDAIGLRYICSFLKRHGFDVDLIFFKEKYLTSDLMVLPTEREYKLFVDLCAELKPDVVGISLRSSFFKIASALTKGVKDRLDVPVIWGGTHPTVAPEESIQVADMICVGEGEYPMLELAQRISQGQDVRDIQNLWVRNGNEVIRNPVRPLLRDLDSLPFPDYGDEGKYLIDENKISSYDPGLEVFNLNIMASRGCPYHCTYCCNSVFRDIHRGKGPAIRRRSVDNVIEEIESLKDRFPNLKRIDFIDEVFAWDKEWTSRFISKYKERINLPFQCAQHPNMVDRDILRMLTEAGLERVEVGIQSGSERIRREIFERPVSDETLLRTGRIIRDLNIVPFYDIIVDNPFETEEDKKLSLDLILKLPRPFHLHVFSLIYFPNTILTKKALASKVISEDQVEGRAERTFNQMFVSLDYPRPNSDRFWISLYSLTSKSFVPKRLIRWLSRIGFLKEHPRPVVLFAILSNYIKLGIIAVKWLLEGKPVFSTLRQTAKRKSSPII